MFPWKEKFPYRHHKYVRNREQVYFIMLLKQFKFIEFSLLFLDMNCQIL